MLGGFGYPSYVRLGEKIQSYVRTSEVRLG